MEWIRYIIFFYTNTSRYSNICFVNYQDLPEGTMLAQSGDRGHGSSRGSLPSAGKFSTLVLEVCPESDNGATEQNNTNP